MGPEPKSSSSKGGSTDGTYGKIQELMASYRGPAELKLYKQEGEGKGMPFDWASPKPPDHCSWFSMPT